MSKIEIMTRVASDGTLTVPVPITLAAANATVRVTVEAANVPGLPEMTQDEWKRFVAATAGSITDPEFRRHDQGVFERRESFE